MFKKLILKYTEITNGCIYFAITKTAPSTCCLLKNPLGIFSLIKFIKHQENKITFFYLFGPDISGILVNTLLKKNFI